MIVSSRRRGTGVNCSINFADAAELRRAFEFCEKMRRQFSQQVRLSEMESNFGNYWIKSVYSLPSQVILLPQTSTIHFPCFVKY
jgi:hypothetical protein